MSPKSKNLQNPVEMLGKLQVTPQEVAEVADLHINTVKKIVRNEAVHRNSVTKFWRALDTLQNRTIDNVHELHKHEHINRIQPTPAIASKLLEDAANMLDAIIRKARSDPGLFLELEIEQLMTDCDRIQASIGILESGQKRREQNC